MKKGLFSFAVVLMLFFVLTLPVGADKVYEYDIGKEAAEGGEDVRSELLEDLPPDIREALPENADSSVEEYDAKYFWDMIAKALSDAVAPFVSTVSALLGTVIIAAVFHSFAQSVGEGVRGVFSMCSSLCITLCVYSSMQTVFSAVSTMLSVMSDTMLVMIPAMEAVYISAGNLTSAAVTATGIQLMIGFTQSVFSKILSPAVFAVFILAVTSAVTGNVGISYMVKTLKGMITGAVIIIMSLFTFVLSLQVTVAQAQDTLAAKTIRFAIGSYIPIVGGPVAESFSVMSASLSVIKQGSGIIGIVVIIIAFVPTFAVLLLNRIAVGLSGACAGMLGCSREGALLEECKGICTLLMAVSTASAVMYIIALGIFCRTSLAVG